MGKLASSVEDCMGGLKFKIRVPSKDPKKETKGIQEVEVIVHMVGDETEKFDKENQALKSTIKDCKLAINELQKTKDDFQRLLEGRKSDTFTPEEATIKGREIILQARRKAKELKETAMSEAMSVEREISRLRALKRIMEKGVRPI